MTLYRVQSMLDGRGPWLPGISQTWVDNSRTGEQYRALVPWTKQFDRREVFAQRQPGEHIGCGCVTPEQLRLWFTLEEYATLIGRGYQCVQFDDARILAQSDIQCVFARPFPLHWTVDLFPLY